MPNICGASHNISAIYNTGNICSFAPFDNISGKYLFVSESTFILLLLLKSIDLLPRLKPWDSHGTAPLDWDIVIHGTT